MFLNKLKAGIKTETILPKFTFAGLIFQTTKKSKRREERGEEQEKFYQWEGGKIDWVHQITTFYLVFQHFKLLFKMLLFFFFFFGMHATFSKRSSWFSQCTKKLSISFK